MRQGFKELHTFITRRKVIELYRDCLRESRKLPKSTRGKLTKLIKLIIKVGDLISYTREQFEINRKEDNLSVIRHLIASGREELESNINI